MRIGIFGGTFDPVHMGHLILAEQCRAQARLDEVWFVPSYTPPHKAEKGVTRFEQRCDMIELAIAGAEPRVQGGSHREGTAGAELHGQPHPRRTSHATPR